MSITSRPEGPSRSDEHPALAALDEIQDILEDAPAESLPGRACRLAHDAYPALEALIAECDVLRTALEGFVDLVSQDDHGFHDGTDMGRALKRGRAALAKGKS